MFCAYCAQRSPPVLARHRFVECTYRQLSGQPEFSLGALHALEARLDAKESCVREHLRLGGHCLLEGSAVCRQ